MRRVILTLTLAACGSGTVPDAGTWAGSMVATEDFRVDADVADLTGAMWMLVRDDGYILIPQSKDRVIKVVSPDSIVSTIGRAGGGPGEFNRLIRIGWIGDSLWALDPGLKRVTIFGPDFELVRTFPEPLTIVRPANRPGADTASFEIFHQAVLPGGAMRFVVHFRFGLPLPDWSPPVDSGVSLYVRTSEAGIFEEVLGEAPPDSCVVSYRLPNGMGGTRRPICDQPIATDWEGGSSIAYSTTSHGDSGSFYLVRLVDDHGRVIFESAVPFTPIPVTPGAADSVMRPIIEAKRAQPKLVRDAYPTLEPDTTFPPVRRLVLGRAGGVWVEEETRHPRHHWRFLDASGQPRFTVVLPSSTRLMAADAAHIWGIDEDADGLLSVVRLVLTPELSPE